jgi:YfiH family protein
VQAPPHRLPALFCEPLGEHADHLFTSRHWKLGRRHRSDDDGWDEIARTLGVAAGRLSRARQVHGASVALGTEVASALPDADILVSDRADLGIAIQVADCVPVLAVDPRTGAVAAAHAGWRGLAANVPGEMVRALSRRFDARPVDLLAAVGPAIGPCCYEVGADVRDSFARAFSSESGGWFAPGGAPKKWMLDTWASARTQLLAAGVLPHHIFEARLCTASHPDAFCSYRRDGPPAGRMAAAIKRRARG